MLFSNKYKQSFVLFDNPLGILNGIYIDCGESFTILQAEHFFLARRLPHVLQTSSSSMNFWPLIPWHRTYSAVGWSPYTEIYGWISYASNNPIHSTKTNWFSELFIQLILMNKLLKNIQICFIISMSSFGSKLGGG